MLDVPRDTVRVRDVGDHEVRPLETDTAVPEDILEEAALHCFDTLHLVEGHFAHTIGDEELFPEMDDAPIGHENRGVPLAQEKEEKPVVIRKEENESTEKCNVRKPHIVVRADTCKKKEEHTDSQEKSVRDTGNHELNPVLRHDAEKPFAI